jgi:hypothetical protein
VSIVAWKALAAAALVPFAFEAPRRGLAALFRSTSPPVFVAVFAASRLGACVLAFVVAGLALPSDVRGYYATFADAVLAGGRHPSSPYNPGFDYLLALLRWWSPSLLGVVIFMIAAEVAALVLVRRILDRHAPAWSWPLVVLWLVSPVSLLYVALGGQDEALILLVWAGVATMALGGRSVAAGIAAAGGFAGTKLLGLCAALPLAGLPIARTWRAGLAAMVATAVIAGLCVGLAIPFGNVLGEARLVTSGNVWALPVLASGGRPQPRFVFVAVAVICLAAAILHMRRHPWPTSIAQILRMSGTTGCLFLLVSQKSFAHYLVMFLPGVFFLILQAPPAARALLLSIVLPISAVEPSLWFHFREGDALVESRAARLAMLAADVPLVLGYLGLVGVGLRPMPDVSRAAEV